MTCLQARRLVICRRVWFEAEGLEGSKREEETGTHANRGELERRGCQGYSGVSCREDAYRCGARYDKEC